MSFDRLVCPVCLGGLFTSLTTTDDPFPAVRCAGCGLGVERHVAGDLAGDGYYGPSVYAGLRDGGPGKSPLHRWHHDVAVAHARIEQVRDVVPPSGRWIDVGCNLGAHLVAAGRLGYDAIGIELTVDGCRSARRVTGRPVYEFSDWAAPSEGFPVKTATVTSFYDVIEHALDPVRLVSAAVRTLHLPGTALVIEVPDLDTAEDFAAWRHRRVYREVTEHVWHFCEKSLRVLGERYAPGFALKSLERPVPGKLQAVWTRSNGGVHYGD